MFMVHSSWLSHCESSPGSSDECRAVPSGHWYSDQANHRHFIITQLESWYSFYRPTYGQTRHTASTQMPQVIEKKN